MKDNHDQDRTKTGSSMGNKFQKLTKDKCIQINKTTSLMAINFWAGYCTVFLQSFTQISKKDATDPG